MKINLPVNEIETLLPEGEFIYSRTGETFATTQ